MNSAVGSASESHAIGLRKERNVLFENMQELENKKLTALDRLANEKEQFKEASGKIRKYIVKGMTKSEVQAILGDPISTRKDDPLLGRYETFDDIDFWFYGEITVCFKVPSGYRKTDLRVWGIKLNDSDKGCQAELLAQ